MPNSSMSEVVADEVRERFGLVDANDVVAKVIANSKRIEQIIAVHSGPKVGDFLLDLEILQVDDAQSRRCSSPEQRSLV